MRPRIGRLTSIQWGSSGFCNVPQGVVGGSRLQSADPPPEAAAPHGGSPCRPLAAFAANGISRHNLTGPDVMGSIRNGRRIRAQTWEFLDPTTRGNENCNETPFCWGMAP